MGRLAEIELAGGSAFQHHLPELCRLVEHGKIVRLVDLRTGRHRGWFTRERPPGCEPERVAVFRLHRSVGWVLDAVRDGVVYEVYDFRSGRVRGYIYWCAPEWLAELASTPLTYTYRSRSGRVIKRHLYPLHVESETPPLRRAVPTHA